MLKIKRLFFFHSLVLLLTYNSAHAQDEIDQFLDQPLKDLMQMEVTSVSKRAEKATEAAAAIYVISQEDIRRSGYNTVPEVLRMAPGVQVSRINSGWWAISARGNANSFGNKLLVLIDGRSIYNPLFSGVLWEEQSVPLENIERIEIIRGPGSTLWGANAVNGVINIITKNSKDTQGNFASAGMGTYDKFNGLYRHGGKLDDENTYSSYLNNYKQGDSKTEAGDKTYDSWNMSRAGLRVDGDKGNSNYSVQSDFYTGNRNVPFTNVPAINAAGFVNGSEEHDMYGGNIIAKYGKELENGSDIDFQAYYDFAGRNANLFGYKIHTVDLDGQQHINLNENHEFVWGASYRMVYSEWQQSDIAIYNHGKEVTTHLFSGFAQDKIQLLPDELFFTLGSKIEHNTYTGIEVEPNIRLTWLPADNQTIWAAVTRAVRTPSPTEMELTQVIQGNAFGLVNITDNENFKSEKLMAYELGYRIQPDKDVSLDITAFINDYDELRTIEALAVPVGPGVIASFTPENKGYGISRGIELAANWQVNEKWMLVGSYSFLDMNIKLDNSSADFIGRSEDGTSPSTMFNIRSHYKFSDEWELSNALYYQDEIEGAGTDNHDVADFIRFDVNVTWKPMPSTEISLIGHNLLDDRHQEFGSAFYSQPSQIPRSVFAKATFRF